MANKRGPKQSTYRKTHLTRWRKGWRYKRRVPKAMAPLVGATFWTKYLGAVSEPDAVIAARKLDVQHDDVIARLQRLPSQERIELAAAGGIKQVSAEVGALETAASFVSAAANAFSEADVDLEHSGPQQDGHGDWYVADPLEEIKEIRRAHTASAALRGTLGKRKALVAKMHKTTLSARLEALVEVWQSVASPKNKKTIQKMRLYVCRFVDCVGDLAPRDVTRAHVIEFRNALNAENQSRTNIQHHLNALHRVFGVAVSEGLIDTNPAADVRVGKPASTKFADEKRKRPFTGSQVIAILEASKALNDRYADDMRWVIRLLVYHGARSGEIVQLRPNDVTSIAGVPSLRITDEVGSLKNKFSKREIPIHPDCAGIIQRAVAMSGEEWLFPTLANSKDRGARFQRIASRFLRTEVGIADDSLTMHSLRHTWRTVAREIDMPEAVSRAIMGHSLGKDDHASYGGLPSMAKRAEWMAKVDPLKA